MQAIGGVVVEFRSLYERAFAFPLAFALLSRANSQSDGSKSQASFVLRFSPHLAALGQQLSVCWPPAQNGLSLSATAELPDAFEEAVTCRALSL